MKEKVGELWGLPVYVNPHLKPGTAILGRMPTWQEVIEAGSFEEAVKRMKEKHQAEIINGLSTSTDNQQPR